MTIDAGLVLLNLRIVGLIMAARRAVQNHHARSVFADVDLRVGRLRDRVVDQPVYGVFDALNWIRVRISAWRGSSVFPAGILLMLKMKASASAVC